VSAIARGTRLVGAKRRPASSRRLSLNSGDEQGVLSEADGDQAKVTKKAENTTNRGPWTKEDVSFNFLNPPPRKVILTVGKVELLLQALKISIKNGGKVTVKELAQEFSGRGYWGVYERWRDWRKGHGMFGSRKSETSESFVLSDYVNPLQS
jgi:hypothetical protein